MGKKDVRLSCFEIHPVEETLTKKISFLKDVNCSIEVLDNIDKRCRKLSDVTVDGEQEFISKISKDNDGLFCTFLHMREGNSRLIQKELLLKHSFSLDEIQSEEASEIAGQLKDYTFFLLTKDLLILKMTKCINISDIAIYLNWMLKKAKPDYASRSALLQLRQRFRKNFNPLDIGSIEVGGNIKIKEQYLIETVVKPIVDGFLEKFIKSSGMNDIDINKIIQASVVLRIKRGTDKDIEKRKLLLQALLDSCSDDSTVIKNKTGNKITPDCVKETKIVKIAPSSSSFLDADALEQEMRIYYNELK